MRGGIVEGHEMTSPGNGVMSRLLRHWIPVVPREPQQAGVETGPPHFCDGQGKR